MIDRYAGGRFAVVGIVLAAAVLTGCDRPQAQDEAKASAAAAAPAVTVSRPLIEDIIDWDEYTGRFDAIDTV